MRKLVILGGGYGGMRILQKILPNLPDSVEVTLIDKLPYHCLKTEYYALAAGTLSDQHVRVPFPTHERLHIVYAEVVSIALEKQQVILADAEPLTYDDLVIGLGCEDKYHDVPGAAEFTYSIQSIESSRNTFLALNNLQAHSKVAIVGAGLSGVELASELHESRPDLEIMIFDRGKNILSAFPERLSNYVAEWFYERDVQIINHANITKVDEGILFNNNEPVQCDAIVWTAGIQPNKVVRELDLEKDRQGRLMVTHYHHLPNNENIYVVGDCASSEHAPSAQLAEAQAEQVALVLLKKWNGEELPDRLPKIKMKGILGSLGKKHGFGLVAEKPITGRVPRLLKSGILWLYKFHNG
ncbi:NAD(P)/FAD-dependent oxidoreductase [Bacillus kwashiorkori]|uniref:NAD(P)/FAD-dependent oxidoreductase n=1 Tax=Bacillus kwashiorkori TaxID=1522318 RepID=UPI000783FEFD|nr:NAD(P)/FAD-dependent oxidoreductase [Bacillus kwashiorkori]